MGSDKNISDALSTEPYLNQEWVSGIRSGDHAAFEALFREYYNPLHAFIQDQVQPQEIAEDLVQNVFLRLWQKRKTLDVRGTIRGYLYGAARLEVIDHYRRKGVRMREEGSRTQADPMPGMGDPHPSAEELVHTAELRQAIRHAADDLPERCRVIVTMRWEHQLSHAEIAQALGISRKTVENQMTIAFKVFRSALQSFRL